MVTFNCPFQDNLIA